MVFKMTALLLAIVLSLAGCATALRPQEEVCGEIRREIAVAAMSLEREVTLQNCVVVCEDMQTHTKKYLVLQKRVSSGCVAAYDQLNAYLSDIMGAAQICRCSDRNARELPQPDNGPPPMLRVHKW